MDNFDILIVGSGISGLIANKYILNHDKKIKIKLIEAELRPGGRMFSQSVGDFTAEWGAQFVVSVYKNLWSLIKQLGLEEDLIPIDTKLAIVRGGRMNWLDPKSPYSLLTYRGLSSYSKIRLLALAFDVIGNRLLGIDLNDFRTSVRLDNIDCRTYLLKLVGRENLDFFCDTAIRSVWFHDSKYMSKAFLLSALNKLIGFKLYWLKSGVGNIAAKLAYGADISYGETVTSIERIAHHVYVKSRDSNGTEIQRYAKKVLICVPGNRINDLVINLKPYEKEFFTNVEYASTLSAAIVTPSQPFEGASVVWFPRSENPIIAGTMVSPQRSVDGQYLITAAFHDEAAKEYISMPYEKQKEALDRGLSHFLPDDYEVLGIQKWHDAIPMFKPGHIKRIVEFEKRLLDENDMIYYAGDTYGGPYIEGAILSGIKAADLMINNI